MIIRHAYDPDGLFDIDPAEESHAAALHDQDVLDVIAARDEGEMVRLVSENTHLPEHARATAGARGGRRGPHPPRRDPRGAGRRR